MSGALGFVLLALLQSLLDKLAAPAFAYGRTLFLWVGGSIIARFRGAANRKTLSNRDIRQLERWLIGDQSLVGPRAGEFGRTSPISANAPFQTTWSQRSFAAKPRMFLTLSAVFALTQHDLARRRVDFAARRIAALFDHDRILVVQSRSTSPLTDPIPEISYRHTLGGAVLLHRVGGWSGCPRRVLDAMIDPAADWQTAEGGWRERTDLPATDLFASAYAARLLMFAADETTLSRTERERSRSQLVTTLDYLEGHWRTQRWAYGNVVSEENAPYILIEVADVMLQHREHLLDEILGHIQTEWLNPAQLFRESYLRAPGILKTTSVAALSARMAYALCRGRQNRNVWLPLYEQAIRLWRRELVTATEVSYLLDLTMRLRSPAASPDTPHSRLPPTLHE